MCLPISFVPGSLLASCHTLLRSGSKIDRVDPFYGFDWNKSQTVRLFKVKGGRDRTDKIHGKAEITFQNGDEVSGSYIHGQRNGYCVIKSILKGIDHLSGY